MKKILCVSNSFGEDATYYLHELCKAHGQETKIVNLYIAGCSIQEHWKNILQKNKLYRYELNGDFSEGTPVDILQVLQEEKWDHIVSQQSSSFSGELSKYYPEGQLLYGYFARVVPEARLWIQQTWAFEKDCTLDSFKKYHNNQEEMFGKIVQANEVFANDLNLGVIPSGKIIQKLRELPEFDLSRGKPSLCRDGFHLDLLYGRYAVSAVWYKKIFNRMPCGDVYIPELPLDNPRKANVDLINKINKEVDEFVS